MTDPVSIALEGSPSLWQLATGPAGGLVLFAFIFGAMTGAVLMSRYVFSDKLAVLAAHHDAQVASQELVFQAKIDALSKQVEMLRIELDARNAKLAQWEVLLDATLKEKLANSSTT